MPPLALSTAAVISGTFENAIRFSALLFDSAVWTSSPLNRLPPPTGISSLRPIMSMFRTAAIVVSGASGCSVYAHAPSRPRSSEFQAAPLLRGQRVGFRNLDERDHARAVVIRAVENLGCVGAIVIVVRRDDHPLVSEPRIASLEQRHDVAIRHDVTLDRCADGHTFARKRDGCEAPGGFRGFGQIVK